MSDKKTFKLQKKDFEQTQKRIEQTKIALQYLNGTKKVLDNISKTALKNKLDKEHPDYIVYKDIVKSVNKTEKLYRKAREEFKLKNNLSDKQLDELIEKAYEEDHVPQLK